MSNQLLCLFNMSRNNEKKARIKKKLQIIKLHRNNVRLNNQCMHFTSNELQTNVHFSF